MFGLMPGLSAYEKRAFSGSVNNRILGEHLSVNISVYRSILFLVEEMTGT